MPSSNTQPRPSLSAAETAAAAECERRIASLLQSGTGSERVVSGASQAVYDLLTRRPDLPTPVPEFVDAHGAQKDWYRAIRDLLESSLNSESEFAWESNPGWFGIDTHPEKSVKGGPELKAYASVALPDYAFVRFLPQLARDLREIAVRTGDSVKVKIPESFSGFVAHNDSIVVHFRQIENSAPIRDAVSAWLSRNGLSESARAFGRTAFAADSQDASFTQLVAENVGSWVAEHAANYDPAILAKEAVRHAVRQASVPPKGIGGE